jgi:hypothetical protein
MKNRSTVLLRVGLVFIYCVIFGSGGSTSSAYQIRQSSLNQGGAVWLPRSNLRLCSSVGQYLAGKQTGASISMDVGFWNPWVTWAVPVEEDEDSWFPPDFKLRQNHPNPFNAATLIQYTLPRASQVRVQIYNLLGQKIRLLVDEKQESGSREARWDGTNDGRVEVGSGIYFCRIEAGDFVGCMKMTLIK